MNNDNQIPDLPKVNNDVEIQDSVNQVSLQTDNNDNEAVKMVTDVKDTAIKETKSIIAFLKDVFKYITTRNSSDLMALLWRLVLIALFIIVLYVPFQLVRDLGINLLIMVGVNFNDQILNIWNSIWAIIYGIIAIVLFFILCRERYYKLIKSQEEKEKVINNNK